MIKKIIKKETIINFFSCIFLLFGIFVILLSRYILLDFPDATAEQLLFSLQTAGGTGSTIILDGALYIVPRLLIAFLIIIGLFYGCKRFFRRNYELIFNFRNKVFKLSLVPFPPLLKLLCSLLFMFILLYASLKSLGIIEYFSKDNLSLYIEENYVNPKNIDIEPPSEKQNLIYIYVESLETSFFSYENGGNFKKSVIPHSESLAIDNTSFSRGDSYTGAYSLHGTGWTMAGMVASTAGIPLKLGVESNSSNFHGDFLPGAYSLGEILKENGYKNYLLIGSDAKFGQRDEYFTQHGDYEIYDYKFAKKQKWIASDYSKWWGYEDKKLYKFAKENLSRIASNSESFNFTMLTADTHAQDGYHYKDCGTEYNVPLLKSYNCADAMLFDFVEWIQKQDFYENTTIVITGDHHSMQGDLLKIFEYSGDEANDRGIYNTFINAKANTNNTKNRQFSAMDFFPTTLAAMGFKINGDKLGLGTNLFSDTPTLIERDGILMNGELMKRSKFYNDKLFKK